MREDRLTAVDRAIQVYQARRAALQKRVFELALEDRYALDGCLETGAVRRASLDLTRALADLRRPDNV
jgi:hypothetical protein